MARSPNLQIELLSYFELPKPGVLLEAFRLSGYEQTCVQENLTDLLLSGLVEARNVTDARGKPYIGQLVSLTPSGHSVLANMRCTFRTSVENAT